jgi:hypothetical protein
MFDAEQMEEQPNKTVGWRMRKKENKCNGACLEAVERRSSSLSGGVADRDPKADPPSQASS